MSSTKRIRLELSAVEPHTPPASAGIMAGTEIRQLPPHVQTSQTRAAPLTLATLSLEAFTLIARYLSATDVLNLRQTARYFRHALCIELYGSPLLQRSLDLIRHRRSYNEQTQTLDLRGVICPPQGITEEDYTEYLYTINSVLKQHYTWAATHIRTLIVPLETIVKWKLTAALYNMVYFLSGVTHLHLILSPLSLPPLSINHQEKLFENLKALKIIPIQKITLENTYDSAELPVILYQALISQLFNPNVRELSIANIASSRFYQQDFSLPENSTYTKLDTLDFSLSHAGVLQIQQLSDTVTCLRTNGTTHIQGYAPGIKRLEILASRAEGTGSYEHLEQSVRALPALKTIYVESPADHFQHTRILQALSRLPPSDLSITFSTLHIHQPALLERFVSIFRAGVYLPEEMTFHFCAFTSIDCFINLVRRGELRQLKQIRYQMDSIFTPAFPFISALVALLQTGWLPHMTHFTLTYQYNPTTFPYGKEAGTPFLQSPEGKSLLMQSHARFTLRDMLRHETHYALLPNFLDPEKKLSEYIHDNTEVQHILTKLHQALVEVMHTYAYLKTQTCTMLEWQIHLESLYLALYNTYFQHLHVAEVPQPFLLFCRQLLPQTIFDTTLGQQLNLNIQVLLLKEMAENKYLRLKQYLDLRPELAGYHLIVRNIIASSTGFNIDFIWQPNRQITPHSVM